MVGTQLDVHVFMCLFYLPICVCQRCRLSQSAAEERKDFMRHFNPGTNILPHFVSFRANAVVAHSSYRYKLHFVSMNYTISMRN